MYHHMIVQHSIQKAICDAQEHRKFTMLALVLAASKLVMSLRIWVM